MKTESDSIEISDDVSNDSALPLEVPPVTEAIKKDHIDVEASNIETRCKSEPDIIVRDSKPVINNENLLFSNKLNSSGERILDASKSEIELASSSYENKKTIVC